MHLKKCRQKRIQKKNFGDNRDSLQVYEPYVYHKQKDGILVVYQSDVVSESLKQRIVSVTNEDMVKKLKMDPGFRTIRNCTPF